MNKIQIAMRLNKSTDVKEKYYLLRLLKDKIKIELSFINEYVHLREVELFKLHKYNSEQILKLYEKNKLNLLRGLILQCISRREKIK